MLAQLLEDLAEPERHRGPRGERQRPAIRLDGLGLPAQVVERVPQVGVGALRGGLDGERQAKLFDRRRELSPLPEDVAEVVVRLEELRREGDGLPVVPLRGVDLAALGVLGAERVLDLVPPRQGQGLFVPARAVVLEGGGEIVGGGAHG